MPRVITLCTTILGVLAWIFPVEAAPIVELSAGATKHQGLNVAHDKQFCWLAAADGTYQRIDLGTVTAFRKVGREFRTLSASEVASDIKKDCPRNMEVKAKGNHVVCAPKGKAPLYSEVIDEVEKSFGGYFSRRGWSLQQSQYPLVMVVHPSRKDFDRECEAVGMQAAPELKGFYHPQTNRVTLFDVDAEHSSGNPVGNRTGTKAGAELSSEARSTVVHETIHQLAFNSGLHPRIGRNPRWIVEGLATTLEAGALQSTVRGDKAGRINRERFELFQKNRSKRKAGTLEKMILDDDPMYATNPVDYYSEAWAFTFYLAETHRADYVSYLQRIAARNPLDEEYTPQERLADFQAVFGTDIRWIETQFLRFIDGLE